MQYKNCPDCKLLKPLSDFGRNSSLTDGLQFYCRACCARRGAATYRRKRAKLGKTVREPVVVPPGYKRCPGCKEIKPHAEWSKNRRTADGYGSRCKSCVSVYARAHYLKRTFGLTEQELVAMIEEQGGVCAICRTAKPIHTDHDHTTGFVRGVLCGPCNMGLGQFADDPQRLKGAIDYLDRAKFAALGVTVTVTPVEQEIYVDIADWHAA